MISWAQPALASGDEAELADGAGTPAGTLSPGALWAPASDETCPVAPPPRPWRPVTAPQPPCRLLPTHPSPEPPWPGPLQPQELAARGLSPQPLCLCDPGGTECGNGAGGGRAQRPGRGGVSSRQASSCLSLRLRWPSGKRGVSMAGETLGMGTPAGPWV